MTYQAPRIDPERNITSLQLPCHSMAHHLALKLAAALEATADLPATAEPLKEALAKLGGAAIIRERLLSLLHGDSSSPSDELLATYAELAPHLAKHLWTRNLSCPSGDVEPDSDVTVQVSVDGKQAFLCVDREKSWQFENLFTGEKRTFPHAKYIDLSDTVYFGEGEGDAYIIAHAINSVGNQVHLYNLSRGAVSAVIGHDRSQWLPPSFSPDGQRAYLLSRGSGPWEIREIFSDRLVFTHPRLGLHFDVSYRPGTNTPFIRAEVLSRPVLINGDTGTLIPLPHNKPLRIKRPAFSADGSVALTIVECEDTIYVLDLQTGAWREFPETEWIVDDPVVSPDGKEAFVRAAQEGGGSAILDAITLSPTLLLFDRHSGAETPEFSPDGTRAFVRVLNAASVSLLDLHSKTELRDTIRNAPVNVLSPIFFTADNTAAFTLAASMARCGVFNVYTESFTPFPDGVIEVFEWEPITSLDGQHIIAKLAPPTGEDLLYNLRNNSLIPLPTGYKVSGDSALWAAGTSSILVILENATGEDHVFDLTGDVIASFNRQRAREERSE